MIKEVKRDPHGLFPTPEQELKLIEPIVESPSGIYIANTPVNYKYSDASWLSRMDKRFLDRTIGPGSFESCSQSVIIWLDFFSGRDPMWPNSDEEGYHYALLTGGPPDPHKIDSVDSLGHVDFKSDVIPLPIMSRLLGKGQAGYYQEDLEYDLNELEERYTTFVDFVSQLHFNFPGKVYIGDRADWEPTYGITGREDYSMQNVTKMLSKCIPISPVAAHEFLELFIDSKRVNHWPDSLETITNKMDTDSGGQSESIQKYAQNTRNHARQIAEQNRKGGVDLSAVLATGNQNMQSELETVELTITGPHVLVVNEPMLANLLSQKLETKLIVGKNAQTGLDYINERFGITRSADDIGSSETPF